MPTIQKIISGRKSKSSGDQFERILKQSAQLYGWKVNHHPSGCKRIWTPNGIVTQAVQTKYDFTFIKNKVAMFIDAKTISSKSYTFSMITRHQLVALYEAEQEGFVAGYIVNFSSENKTVFFKASELNKLSERKGLKPDDGKLIGSNQIVNLNLLLAFA